MFNIFKKIGNFFLDIIQTVVIALALFVICYLFFFQPHQVKGQSMMPNFLNNEFLLTDKISYRLGKPQRGDVIIFIAPKNEEYQYIKRIIGLPGDTVKVENGSVFVNGKKLKEEYLPKALKTKHGIFLKEGQTFSVPEGQYIVMGDNRNHSSDSREWGTVPQKNIIGKAWLTYWPLSKFGLVKHR